MDQITPLTRRDFMAAASTSLGAAAVLSRSARAARREDTINVGLIGCGGRGTGAAVNSMEAGEHVRIVALADAFPERLSACRGRLAEHGDRAMVSDQNCYVGFDAYRELCANADVDMVILATPPHFRPFHLEEAIRRGKNVFMEKPVAVDPAGVRRVFAAGEMAKEKGLSIVSGTQRRHEACYLEAMERIRRGDLGTVTSARVYWNQGGLWVVERTPEMSDMEWQLRNWLYFTWLSGDHIVEQHIHNIDVMNWVMGGPPVRAVGVGGRQARTDEKYGHIFDHFGIQFEYEGNRFGLSMCRQQDGTDSRVEEFIHGSEGMARLRSGFARIEGKAPWQWRGSMNPYVQEHVDLQASVRGGARSDAYLNEARRVGESTLTAIMGREACYTGKEITWDEMLSSKLDLTPPTYEFGPLPVAPVAVPGKTKFV